MLDLLATCTFGLEAVVARELEQLGYDAKPVATGRVAFTGDWRAVCEANLWLRAADRVLIRVGSMEVGGGDPGFDQLFDGVKALPWERFIARDAAFPVAGRSVRSDITSEPAIQRATKRAIVERLRTAYASSGVPALLPETAPKIQIEVALVNNLATLTIDTTGPGLHKRGYREHRADTHDPTGAGEAALRETLAAGLVLLSVWRPVGPGAKRVLLDPFCGSGTIAIEAALIARSIAPGLRRTFDCESWLDPRPQPHSSSRSRPLLIDPALWEEVRADARDAITPPAPSPLILASDIDDRALALARANARAAAVPDDITFSRADARDLASPHHFGVIVTNPPYGIRLGADGRPGVGIDRDVDRLYRALPIVFRRLPTWSFHILTAVLELETLFAQPATRRRKLYNSTIECTYFSFLGPRPPALLPGGAGIPPASVSDDAGAASDSVQVEAGVAPAFASDVHSPPSEPDGIAPGPPAPASTLAPTFGGLRDRDLRELNDFSRCLANNLRHLRKYPARGITCYRVYERDVTDVPLIIDRYADRFHVAEYERQHSRTAAQQADWFDRVRAAIARVAEVPPEHVFIKEKHRQRGLTQHEKLAEARNTLIVSEGGGGAADDHHPALKFEVNLSDYVDTGLFLDHRLTRRTVRAESSGKRFLNLFCYTGSFTVYAIQGGAIATTSVDLSNTYLAWARRNLDLNFPALPNPRAHRGVCDDVLAFLRAHPTGEHYDLAVVDPPTFSNSKSLEDDWEVGRQYLDLLADLRPLMSPAAVVYFSNNFRRFKFDHDAVAQLGWSPREISAQTVPPEYRNRKVHRCWRLVNAR